MATNTDAERVAAALLVSVGLLVRRVRQAWSDGDLQTDDDLTLPETAALARLDRGGPATAAELAKREQISPQSMGATLAALEARGFVDRRPDPADGRRAVVSPTKRGLRALRTRRNARTERLAHALAADFTPAEIAQLMAAAPLIERLAHGI